MSPREHHFYVGTLLVCVAFLICFAVYSSRGGLRMPSAFGRGASSKDRSMLYGACRPADAVMTIADLERAGAIPRTSLSRVAPPPGADRDACEVLIVGIPLANTSGLRATTVLFELDAALPPVRFFAAASDQTLQYTPAAGAGLSVVGFDVASGLPLDKGHSAGSWETL